MIYTVTLNPALDYIMNAEKFLLGEVNRSSSAKIVPGGKGINVSRVLKNFGFESTALGFIAGFSGMEIARLIKDIGIKSDFIACGNGFSRINVKIKAEAETEMNADGPEITEKHMKMLLAKIDNIKKGDILVLSGSVPKTLTDNAYSRILEYMIIEQLNANGVTVCVDAEKDLLMNTLKYRPFLIKPNSHELGKIFGVEIGSDKDIVSKYAKILHELGARNVLVSMAGDGAVMVCENGEIMKCDAPKGTVINSVGAGDSMVAGFIAGWLEKQNYEHAFKMGVSAGSASAFSESFAEKEHADKIYDNILIC